MNEKMSRQTAAEFLDTLSDHFDELSFDGVYKDAIDFAVEELSKPTDADLIDAFLEEAEKRKEFDFESQTYWCNDGKVYKAIDSEVVLPVGVKTLFNIIKNQHLVEWEQPKKKLTDEQVKYLKSLIALKFRYLIIIDDDQLIALPCAPERGSDGEWDISRLSVLINISNTFPFVVTNVIMPLVKNDTEPFDIRKALEDAGVEVEG